MARTTVKDVRGMFGRAVGAARAAGLNPDGWTLEEGSSTNGISWKLTSTRKGAGTRLNLGGWGQEYLGMTAGEAYATLYALALAWEAVADARDSK